MKKEIQKMVQYRQEMEIKKTVQCRQETEEEIQKTVQYK